MTVFVPAWDKSALRAWRTRLGYSQEGAAEALSMPLDTYKSLETGRRPVIKPQVVRLALLLEREAQRAAPGAVEASDVHVLGGGTFSHVRNHLALCAPGFGSTAKEIVATCARRGHPATLHLTRMADPGSALVTNADVAALLDRLAADPGVRVVFQTAALCDYDGVAGAVPSGPYADRLVAPRVALALHTAANPLGALRRVRPDLVVVGSKITTGASPNDQRDAAQALLRDHGLDLVLAFDPVTRRAMVVGPAPTPGLATDDRAAAVDALVDHALRAARGREGA